MLEGGSIPGWSVGRSSCRWTTWQLAGKVCADLWCVCHLGELHQCLAPPIRAVFCIVLSIGPLFFCVAMTPIQGLRPSWRRNQASCHNSCYRQNEQLVFGWLIDWFCCFTSQVNSYGHCGTVSSPNHTFSWAGLNKRLTSNSCTYFRL